VHGAAAARAGLVGDVDQNLVALEMARTNEMRRFDARLYKPKAAISCYPADSMRFFISTGGQSMENAPKELAAIKTAADMAEAFTDEGRCRSLMEAMVWPRGRLCPACGYRYSTALAGRRPGLYQCSNRHCRHQFTVTTRTPLHGTKLPLRTWLTAFG